MPMPTQPGWQQPQYPADDPGLPQLQRKLPAAFLHIRVDEPPLEQTWWVNNDVARRWWLPTDWPYAYVGGGRAPYQPGPLALYNAGDEPPLDPHGKNVMDRGTILQQWNAPPWPFQFVAGGRAPYVPGLNPPYNAGDPPPLYVVGGTQEDVVIQQSWQPNPWQWAPTTKGKGPYLPFKSPPLDPPAPMTDMGSAAKTAAFSAQPDPWQYVFFGKGGPFLPRRLHPDEMHIDPVPPRARQYNEAMLSIIAAWQPDPFSYARYQRGRIQRGVQVDDPPFTSPGQLVQTRTAIQAWQRDPWQYHFLGGWQPYMPSKVVILYGKEPPPGGLQPVAQWGAAVRAYQPDPWQYRYEKTHQQPYDRRRSVPGILNVPVNDPPFQIMSQTVAFRSILEAWTPPPPSPFMGGAQPLQPRALPVEITLNPVDDPPFGIRNDRQQLMVVYGQWHDADPLPTLRRQGNNGVWKITISFGFGYFIG